MYLNKFDSFFLLLYNIGYLKNYMNLQEQYLTYYSSYKEEYGILSA